MKGPAVDQLVYEVMYPKPKSSDPQNFQALLQRHLVPEVRLETQAFYGHLSSQEAKYPGLDYSYQPHRVRLSRFQWHRRLFRAFDNLGLTKFEIASLTKWEGTRWAKERFEREQGIVIRDTTADDIEDWVPPELRVPSAPQAHRADVEDMEDVQEDGEMEENDNENENDNDMEDDGEDSDVEIQSVGVELNERLRAAVAQREAGNSDTPMDEEWEQWLKDAVEAGGLPFTATDLSPNANIPGTRPATDNPAMHPRLLNAARLGQWQQIPDFLHDIIRQNIEARRLENSLLDPSPQPNSSGSSTPLSSATATTSSNVSRATSLSRPSLSPRSRIMPSGLSRRPEMSMDSFENALTQISSRRPMPTTTTGASRHVRLNLTRGQGNNS